jgi:elongation factor P
MSIPATQLRPGMIIKHNNDLHSVFSVEHRTPGNLRAFIQAKLRNLRTGAMFEHRFRSPDPIEKVNVDEVDMQFLYADGDSYYFMDTSNYEQTHLTKEVLGDAVDYLIANACQATTLTSFCPSAGTTWPERWSVQKGRLA